MNNLLILFSVFLICSVSYYIYKTRNNKKTRQQTERKRSMEKKLVNTEIYIKLHEKEITKIEEEDKNKLIILIDETYPDFKYRIYQSVPKISPDDLYMCYLIKLNLRSKDIAQIMCKERSSISMKQTRLARKMFGEKASAKMLNSFIHSI